MRERPEQSVRGAGVVSVLYVVITFFMLLQQPGSTTYDTRAELTQRPGDFLSGAFTLWHPESNFGEFQNQAYGYLFPQGTWFVLTDLVGMPDWISQRLWSALILIVACEGARRVARAIGMTDLPALLAGTVFAFSPRLLGTVSVQTAESLPGAVMPWLVLPVVLHLRGRLGPWPTALLSGAAVVCMGGVNAVETAACLPLAVTLVLWGLRHGLADRRFVVGWFAAVGAACLWWALPLLVLARYTPPFYEYVESAGDTTSLIGWSEAARGDSSWLGYLLSGDQPWWPAMYRLTTEPLLIVVAAVVAAIGLAGLTQVRGDIRRPLVFAAVLGLACITVSHGGAAGAPSAELMRSLLDGPLQIFRNVHKIDPLVRLPLALGFGCAAAWGVERLVAWRPRLDPARGPLLLSPLLLVLVLGLPYLANDTRTPGWDAISTPWQQARDFLRSEDSNETGPANRALVVPGSSFALQDWGWTIDEPLVVLGGTRTVTRSQVPLIPGESIRYLSALDQIIATGRATEALVDQLARAGIRYVVLRRDLLRTNTRSPHPGGSAVSLARAGLERVAGFGSAGNGESAVEVFEVPEHLPAVRAAAVEDVATVRGAPESVLGLQAAGLVNPRRPTVLEGEPGWERPANVVTDSNQLRERAFGNNDEGISALMTQDEPWRLIRAVHDFPAGPGRDQVVAKYDGVRSVMASTAQGYADNYGPVTLQSAPYAAIDGNLDTQWVSSIVGAADEQWLRIGFDTPRAVRRVTVTPVADDPRIVPIRVIEVIAGNQRVRAKVAPSGQPVVVDLDDSVVAGVEVRVVEAATDARSARVGLREVEVDGLRPRRTAVLPRSAPYGAPLQFSVTPGRRACNIALAAPDCEVSRVRSAEEEGGLDRTFSTDARQEVRLSGHVVARGTPESARLLDPIERELSVTATSAYGQDPKVAGRFAYDGQPTTAWVSDDTDLYPTLVFEWPEPRTITGLTVRSGGTSQAPVAAIVGSGDDEQRVPLGNDDSVAIEPVRTRRLQVRFEKAPGSGHVVVPEIQLTGADVTRPFFAQTPTGAVCGFGPTLRVDGRDVATRVTGTMADIVNGSPLAFEACDVDDLDEVDGDSPTVNLTAGEHRVVATPNAEFELLDLAVVPEQAVSASAATRRVRIDQWGSSERTLSVAGGPASLLYLPENFNVGWRAEVDGRVLTPVHVDGWQQGWLLPAGDETAVTLRYTPERTYDVVLPVGLAASGLVLIGGFVSLLLLLFGRRGRSIAPEPRPWPATGPPGRIWAVAALVVTLLFLGPVAALGLVAGSLLPRRQLIATCAAVLIIGSGALDALNGPGFVAGAADICAALAVGALACAVLGAPVQPPLQQRPGRRRAVTT